MSDDSPARIVRELTRRGYNADREAVTLLASAPDPEAAIDRSIERAADDALTLSTEHVRAVLDPGESGTPAGESGTADTAHDPSGSIAASPEKTTISTGDDNPETSTHSAGSPVEKRGVRSRESDTGSAGSHAAREAGDTPAGLEAASTRDVPDERSIDIENDVTGASTGTGVYEDFVSVFRDRYERLASMLRPRVNHRPTSAIEDMPGGGEAGLVGMVSDVRSTANGHWLIELEDTSGTFPCLITKDKDLADRVDEILLDEVLAVEGRLADDAGILFVDSLHFPDVPRTYDPSTADRHVRAALVSDVHVGSEEFLAEAWDRFAEWLHTPEADAVEYLLIAGDMVEGVGVYPGQDEELSIVDIYEQYEAFAERLKDVPGDLEIVMIPGNHDAVRLAEPQPAFDDELRSIMSAHDARFAGNPSFVTLEGVTFLMYHGVSLDEVIAEIPDATYDDPHEAMYYLLRKRHVAPQFGERTRVAPEERDYLVIDEVPDVFHAGHVHKLGYGRYHNVTTINSGCWQRQTAFQKSVNLDPDVGFAPIVDLDTLDVTIRKFA